MFIQPSTENTFCHLHNLATGQTLLSFLSSFLHSPGSPTTQLDISLALLKAVWPENKISKHVSSYGPLEQEGGCVS